MIDQTVERIKALRKLNEDLLAALGRVSEDRAVRIMTIHKSQAGTGRWHSLVLAQLLFRRSVVCQAAFQTQQAGTVLMKD
jgi:hypothetical protein